ncbi:MAG: hypothetical protein NVS1B13_26700 [Flavisolibacter sp.]
MQRTELSGVVIMDSTYFGRGFGIMVFKDAATKIVLKMNFIKAETIALYLSGLADIEKSGYKILAVVCDGRRGLLSALRGVPVQMCNFHQVAIVTRYITRNPRMQAGKELKKIAHLLVRTDKESFVGMLDDWLVKWKAFLNERSINPETGKSKYTHTRLRSAHRSLITNLPWLFTWYDNIELNIPNTTNLLEGSFTDLKNKLRNHNGLNQNRKSKFIIEFFKAWPKR